MCLVIVKDEVVLTSLDSVKRLSNEQTAADILAKNGAIEPGVSTVKVLNFRTVRSGKTVQTQIRLLLEEEQSDQGLHCLQFHLHLFDKVP